MVGVELAKESSSTVNSLRFDDARVCLAVLEHETCDFGSVISFFRPSDKHRVSDKRKIKFDCPLSRKQFVL